MALAKQRTAQLLAAEYPLLAFEAGRIPDVEEHLNPAHDQIAAALHPTWTISMLDPDKPLHVSV
jgi:hypothetical protein